MAHKRNYFTKNWRLVQRDKYGNDWENQESFSVVKTYDLGVQTGKKPSRKWNVAYRKGDGKPRRVRVGVTKRVANKVAHDVMRREL